LEKAKIIDNPERKEKILLEIRLRRFFEKLERDPDLAEKMTSYELEVLYKQIQKFKKLNERFRTFYRDYEKLFKKYFPDFRG